MVILTCDLMILPIVDHAMSSRSAKAGRSWSTARSTASTGIGGFGYWSPRSVRRSLTAVWSLSSGMFLSLNSTSELLVLLGETGDVRVGLGTTQEFDELVVVRVSA